ncbi:MAG: glucosamine-6-phosphate deaminase [Clostridia bacterium]|nr:glucosamine-6-phosphate deaminase [Clostridia bacterium]
MVNLFVFDTTDALAEAAATLWTKKIWDKTDLRVCLVDGKTPEPLYQKMIDYYHEGQVCLRDMEAFLLDEFGGLDASDPGRSQNVIRRNLLNWVDFPAGHFQCFEPNATDLEAEIARYDALFEEPMDLTLLGVGTNGHLGMNEPGSMPDSPTRKMNLTQSSINAARYYLEHDRVPTWGVTLGMNRILQSREIWLLATGKYKAGVLKRILTGEPSAETPASWLRNHPNCSIFADREAAAQLWAGSSSASAPINLE